MKKNYLFFGSIIIVLSIASTSLHSNSSGAPAGRTGSPGDGGLTCQSCHYGVPATDQVGSFQVFLNGQAVTSYVDGETYDVSFTIDPGSSNYPKMGFQATVESESNQKVGTLIVTDNSNTKFAGSGQNHITHTSSGNASGAGPKTWNFQWQAPTGLTEAVRFYGSGICANGNGNDNGDIVIQTAEYGLDKDVTSTAENLTESVAVFPNPAASHIQITGQNEWNRAILTSAAGEIASQWNGLLREEATLELPNLKNGIYYLRLESKNGFATKKILVIQE